MANHEYAARYIQDNEGCSVVAEFIVQEESAAKALQGVIKQWNPSRNESFLFHDWLFRS